MVRCASNFLYREIGGNDECYDHRHWKMGRAVAWRLLDGGHNVTLVGHTPGKAEALVEELKRRDKNNSISVALPYTLPGEVVVLAVPYIAAKPVVHEYIELLPGKTLVDITNPVDFQKMEFVVEKGSAAEEIASGTPVSTRVVKALSTIFARTLLDGKMDCLPLDVFLAGNDEQAKQTVSRMVESMGLRLIDTGPLLRARQIEALEFLHMAIQSSNNLGFKSAIKMVG